MADRKQETFGIAGLVIVAFFWGSGFPAVKFAYESFSAFYQIGIRFLIAAVVLSVIFFRKLRFIDKNTIKSGLILSVILFMTYGFTVVGMNYTTSSRASFYSCLSVIIIPFLLKLLYRTKIGRRASVSVVICFVGLFLMSYSNDLSLSLNVGDMLCVLCSFCAAGHVVATERLVLKEGMDSTLLSIVQMAFVSLIGFVFAFTFESAPTSITQNSMLAMLFMGVLCTALAFWMQTTCQKFIGASKIGIIFSFEPIFGAVASYVLLSESLGFRGILGGLFIFISLIYSETGFAFLRKKEMQI